MAPATRTHCRTHAETHLTPSTKGVLVPYVRGNRTQPECPRDDREVFLLSKLTVLWSDESLTRLYSLTPSYPSSFNSRSVLGRLLTS